MNALKEFDYDLWVTDENGVKQDWIRVKATGETVRVSHEVMKLLRNEEKKLRREREAARRRGGSDLSPDAVPAESGSSVWLSDPVDYELGVLQRDELARFRALLTPAQQSVFDECLYGGQSLTEYAAGHGVSVPLVSKRIGLIRKKAKKFFAGNS